MFKSELKIKEKKKLKIPKPNNEYRISANDKCNSNYEKWNFSELLNLTIVVELFYTFEFIIKYNDPS